MEQKKTQNNIGYASLEESLQLCWRDIAEFREGVKGMYAKGYFETVRYEMSRRDNKEYTLGDIVEGFRLAMEDLHKKPLTLADIGLEAYNENEGDKQTDR